MIATATFPVAALWLAGREIWLLVRGDWRGIPRSFGTVSADDELREERDDLKRREAETQQHEAHP